MSVYKYLADLQSEMANIPADSIISRSLHEDDQVKIILFGFAPGQELSEHTASVPASLYFVHGEADLTLGTDTLTARTGTWAHMPPQLPHSIHAKTPVLMLLQMFKIAG